MFARVPVEISYDILGSQVLTPRDLARMSQVDRRCRALVCEGVWRRVAMRSLPRALATEAEERAVSLAQVQSVWAGADETQVLSSVRSWQEYAVLVWLLQKGWTRARVELVHVLSRAGRSFPRGMWPDATGETLGMVRPLDQASTFDVSPDLLVLPRARMMMSQGNKWDWWLMHLDTQEVPCGVPPGEELPHASVRVLSRAASGAYLVVAYVMSMWAHARPVSYTHTVKVYKLSGSRYHFHTELDFDKSPVERDGSVIVFLREADEVVLVHTTSKLSFWSAESGAFRRAESLALFENCRLIRASLSAETETLCIGVPMSIQHLRGYSLQGEHLWSLSGHLRPMHIYSLCYSSPDAPLRVVLAQTDDNETPLRFRPGVFRLAGPMLVVLTEREVMILPSDMGPGLRACYRLDELVKGCGMSTTGDLSLDVLGTRAVLCNTAGVVLLLDWGAAARSCDPVVLQAHALDPLSPSPWVSEYARAQREVLSAVREELDRELPSVFRVALTNTCVYFHMHHWAADGDRSFVVCWDLMGPALRSWDAARYDTYIAPKLVLGPTALLKGY